MVGAVEVRSRRNDGKARTRSVYAGRLRLRVVSDRSAEVLMDFAKGNIAPGAIARTDGWVGYHGFSMAGYRHEALALTGDPDKAEAHLPMIHLVFSNLKTWINGTHHGRIEPKHLQAYLNEYVFRFNRRFYPMTALSNDRVQLRFGDFRADRPAAQLYSGEWTHAA